MSPEAAHGLSSINWWTWESERLPIGWFLIDFFVFAGLILYYTWGPLKAALAERHATIKRAVAQAAAAQAKARDAHQAIRQRMATLEQELSALAAASQRDGEAERAQLEAQANAYADRLAAEGASQADESVRRAQQRLRRRLLGQALRDAEAQVRANITAQDHHRLMEDAIDRLADAQPEGQRKAAS